MTFNAALAATIVALTLLASPARAQQPTHRAAGRDAGWFSLGIGAGRPEGVALSATASFGSRRFVQAGGRTIVALDLFADEALNAVHVAAGVSRATDTGRLAAAVGPAIVWGRRNRVDSEESFAGPGLALDAQWTLAVVPQLGVGVGVYGIVSPGAAAAGLSLLLVFEGNR